MIRKLINFFYRIFRSNSIFFVGSADKLPEPLSKEDEIFYVEKATLGDTEAKK